MRISCSRQAQAQSARDYHHRLYDPSKFSPTKLSRILCRYAVLSTIVSLVLPASASRGVGVGSNSDDREGMVFFTYSHFMTQCSYWSGMACQG